MIILEGMDNTGKTTLYNKLLDEFPQLDRRPSIGNKHDLVEIRRQAEDEAWSPHKLTHTLGDRSRIISEYIYCPILQKREIAYSLDTYTELLAGFSRGHHLVVHCYRSTSRIIDTFDGTGEQLEGVRAHISELSSAYDEVMHMLRFLFRVGGGGGKVITYSFEQRTHGGGFSFGDHYPLVTSAIRRYLHEEDK